MEKGLNPYENIRLMEELRAVKEALAQLTERQRTVLVLRHFQNLKLQEIAGILEVSLGTIKATLHQTLHKLRDILDISSRQKEDHIHSAEKWS